MKKLLLFSLAIAVYSSVLFAQSFNFYDSEGTLLNGQSIVVPTTVNGPEIFYYFSVENTSSTQKSVKIGINLQTELLSEDCKHSICSPGTETGGEYGQCGNEWGETSPPFTLNAYETSLSNGDFRFTQGSVGGITTIEYKVYDIDNEADFITFTITYSTTTAIELDKVKDFAVYPNPAKSNFTINNTFGSNSYVIVYNVLGEKIKKISYLQNEKLTIDCSNWESGYYFCRLYNDGKIEKTVKLVVAN